MNKQSFRIRNTGTIMFLARLFGCYDVINDVILNVPDYLHVQVIWHTVLCLWEKIWKFKNSFLCSKTHLWHVYNVKMPNWTRNESNLMQPSMANLNSPSSRIVKDSTPSRRRILRCIDFGNGESSPNLLLDVVNLYLIKFKERWILNERAFYSFTILFIWKWILTLNK